jgi:hypothetical protein
MVVADTKVCSQVDSLKGSCTGKVLQGAGEHQCAVQEDTLLWTDEREVKYRLRTFEKSTKRVQMPKFNV